MKHLALRKAVTWIVLALVAAFSVYRLRFSPIPVVTHAVASGEIHGEVMGTGTLEARVKTTISPRIQERLAEVFVDQGDMVKSGQLLARLDDAELKQQAAIADAALASARATIERVQADEARAQAVLQQARLGHKRATELIATKVASQSDFDKAVESLRVAEADLKRSQAAIGEARSQVLTAEKNFLYRREQLAFTEIRSPYNGLITRRDRDPGGVVMPGGSLLQLIATNEIWISAWVDETAMAALETNQLARVIFRSEPAKSYAGEVARLGREADRETREFLVDVRLKQLPPNWTVGQRAEVFIENGRKAGVVVLPQSLVLWREGKAGVFVNEDGRARWRALTLGLRGRDLVEVVQGVRAGERVVQPGDPRQGQLTEGRRLKEP